RNQEQRHQQDTFLGNFTHVDFPIVELGWREQGTACCHVEALECRRKVTGVMTSFSKWDGGIQLSAVSKTRLWRDGCPRPSGQPNQSGRLGRSVDFTK